MRFLPFHPKCCISLVVIMGVAGPSMAQEISFLPSSSHIFCFVSCIHISPLTHYIYSNNQLNNSNLYIQSPAAKMTKCISLDDPDNLWTYCPSLPAAILFSVLFGIITTYHIYQAHFFKKSFCWVLIMGAIWETAAFVIRCVAIQNPTSQGAFDPQFLLILLAPLWINAFDYMLLGRMVYYYLPEKRLFGIRAERMALCFVILDLVYVPLIPTLLI